MEFKIEDHIPENFPDSSRVWIYQSDKLIPLSEIFEIESMLKQFTDDWKAHSVPVSGFSTILFGRFIILMADETQTEVSGCSTDASVHLMKNIEQKFGMNLFNRQLLAFVVKEKVEIIPLSQAKYALENGIINGETIFFDNTITSKKDLLNRWMIPVKNNWLNKYLNQSTVSQ